MNDLVICSFDRSSSPRNVWTSRQCLLWSVVWSSLRFQIISRLIETMDGMSSISAIDQKMAEMKIKNLELLKRHQVGIVNVYTNWLFRSLFVRANDTSERERTNDRTRRESDRARDSTIDICRLWVPFFLFLYSLHTHTHTHSL